MRFMVLYETSSSEWIYLHLAVSIAFSISLIDQSVLSLTTSMDEKNGSSPVYKSEVAKNGGWKPFEIDVGIFCNGDLVELEMIFYW